MSYCVSVHVVFTIQCVFAVLVSGSDLINITSPVIVYGPLN